MATIAEIKKVEREKKKKNKAKDKQKKAKILLSKNTEDFKKNLNLENAAELETFLERVLKPARLETFKYSWSEMKNIPKEQRRESRKALMVGLDKEKYEKSKKIRDNFIIGTNSVIRSLEKEKVWCGLVSTDFDPAMIPDHIVSLSRQKRIPVIHLPQLKSVSKHCLGFPVKALAIKKKESLLDEDAYKSLYDEIFRLSGLADLAPEPSKLEISTPSVSKPPRVKRDKPVAKNFILKRPNKNSRCFVPGGNSSTPKELDFISLDNSAENKVPRKTEDKKIVEEDDDSDSDSDVTVPAPKLKPYVPLFQSLKLKKIQSKH